MPPSSNPLAPGCCCGCCLRLAGHGLLASDATATHSYLTPRLSVCALRRYWEKIASGGGGRGGGKGGGKGKGKGKGGKGKGKGKGGKGKGGKRSRDD